jgi:hypothetical protein
MPPFVPVQKNRKPGPSEKADPTCAGSGRVDNRICKICAGSGVVPKDWQPGDGPVKMPMRQGMQGNGS